MMQWQRVFQHPDTLLIGHVRNLVEAAGMPCEIRNWTLSGGMGDLAPIDCEPTLWVAPHNVDRARQVIECWNREMQGTSASEVERWRCERCDEWHDGRFDSCWQCGRARC